jgi:hypothetical protein
MSRATTTLNALKAENLLAGSYLLSQIETLKTQLKYRSNGDTVSFDDYYLKLQAEVEALPRLKLDNVVATGTENQYIMQLVKGLETIFDDADRVVRRVIHFRSKLQNALSQIKKNGSAFNAWYTLAAGEQMEENGVKFPSNQLKDLAQSEFSRLMENLDVEVESLLEAVKVQVEQIKVWKKTQSDKFNLGKDQANASWTSGLPNFGEGDRSDQLLEKSGFEVEEDEDVPAFVAKKPRIIPDVEEAVATAKVENPEPSQCPFGYTKENPGTAHNCAIHKVSDYARPTLETLQAENTVEDAKKPMVFVVDRADGEVVQGTFFKQGDPKSITPIVDDGGPLDIERAAPTLNPAPSPAPVADLTSVFAGATEVKTTPAPAAAAPKPAKIKVAKAEAVFVAPTTEAVVVRTDEDKFPEKIKCVVCDRRIRVSQVMFTRDGDGWRHAIEVDCTGKPAVPHTPKVVDNAPKTDDLFPAPDPVAKAQPGTLLEQLETGAASVPSEGAIVPVPNTTSDNPPETKPLEGSPIGTVKEVQTDGKIVVTLAPDAPSVDVPATPRKRLTFLDEDQEIL